MFVALSLHPTALLSNRSFHWRATGTLGVLFAATLEAFALLVPGDVVPFALAFDVLLPIGLLFALGPGAIRLRTTPGARVLRGSVGIAVLLVQAAAAFTAFIGIKVGLVILAASLMAQISIAILITWQLVTHRETDAAR